LPEEMDVKITIIDIFWFLAKIGHFFAEKQSYDFSSVNKLPI
jgi:hypothetical protein